MKKLHHYKNGVKITGANEYMTGDTSGLYGDCTNFKGDCTGLVGDCSNLSATFVKLEPIAVSFLNTLMHITSEKQEK
jgi:hypothetical protein